MVIGALYNKRSLPVDEALQGLVWSEDKKYTFSDGKGVLVETPVVILPIEWHDGMFHGGFYSQQQGLTFTPLGFQKTTEYDDFFFEFDSSMKLVEVDPRPNTTYLPLQLTEIDTQVGFYQDGSYKNKMGSPFSLYGVRFQYKNLPLMLTYRAVPKLHAISIIRDFNKISTCSCPDAVSRLKLEEFLPTLFNREHVSKKYFFPNNLQDITLPEPKEPIKPIVITEEEKDWSNPQVVKAHLDEYVVGQEEAKKSVAIAVSNFYIRSSCGDERIPKDNLLLLGPTGSGKTYMMRTVAKAIGLTFLEVQATSKSATGYTGDDITSALVNWKKKTGEADPKALVFIDEFDKLCNSQIGSYEGYGKILQNELIGIMEGGEVQGVNTKNMLFVGAGAFQTPSLEEVIRQRLSPKGEIGFGKEVKRIEAGSLLSQVSEKDLERYGFKYELIGRMPIRAVLHKLSQEELRRILAGVKGSILEGYEALFLQRRFVLEIPEETLDVIIKASPAETGARGLKTVCSKLLKEPLFDPLRFADLDHRIFIDPKQAEKLLQA